MRSPTGIFLVLLRSPDVSGSAISIFMLFSLYRSGPEGGRAPSHEIGPSTAKIGGTNPCESRQITCSSYISGSGSVTSARTSPRAHMTGVLEVTSANVVLLMNGSVKNTSVIIPVSWLVSTYWAASKFDKTLSAHCLQKTGDRCLSAQATLWVTRQNGKLTLHPHHGAGVPGNKKPVPRLRCTDRVEKLDEDAEITFSSQSLGQRGSH